MKILIKTLLLLVAFSAQAQSPNEFVDGLPETTVMINGHAYNIWTRGVSFGGIDSHTNTVRFNKIANSTGAVIFRRADEGNFTYQIDGIHQAAFRYETINVLQANEHVIAGVANYFMNYLDDCDNLSTTNGLFRFDISTNNHERMFAGFTNELSMCFKFNNTTSVYDAIEINFDKYFLYPY